MAAEQLQIQVQANVSNAINGLNDLNKTLATTNTAAVKTGTTGMNAITKGTGQASAAITNFSRVASDAPFGLIGIANNIDPLIQSFVSLKRETGSTGAALKALGASLAGGGGLILAVSLITSALQFVELGFSRWGASAKKTKEEQDKLKQSTNDMVSSISKQKEEFIGLVNVAKNLSNSEKERANALERLNNILPDTIGNLTKQNIVTAEGTNIIKAYIKAIEAKATAELLSGRLAANNVKLFDNRNTILTKTIEIENKLVTARANYNKALTATIPNYQVIEAYANDVTNLENRKLEIQKEGRNLASSILNDNELIRKEYERQLNASSVLDKSLSTNKKTTDKTAKSTKTVTDFVKEYRAAISGISFEEQLKGITLSGQKLETNIDFLLRIEKELGKTSNAYKTVAKDTDDFTKAANNQKIAEIITNYKNSIEEINLRSAITGQESLNARITQTVDALLKLKTTTKDNATEVQNLQNELNKLTQEAALLELKRKQEEINKLWQKFGLQINKLNFNQTKNGLDILKNKIDLIGNTIQDLKGKGLTEEDLGLQFLTFQFEQLGLQFSKLKEKQEFLKSLQATFEQGLTGAVDNFIDAFAAGDDPFKALTDSVKQLVIELGKAVIKSLILKAISTAIAGPAGGTAAGAIGGQAFMRGDMIFQAISRGTSRSDKRLKKNIKLIGQSESGINIYQFEYIYKQGIFEGVIAQELLNSKFENAVKVLNGFYAVDYSLIDVEFKEIV